MVKTGSMAVKQVAHIAKLFNLTEFFASFVLAGFISILPELFIGISSALDGVPEVGMATLIGGNIVDLTIVLGILAILGKNIPIRRSNRVSTLPFLVGVGLPLGLMLDGNLGRFDGLLLFMTAVIYFAHVAFARNVQEKKKEPKLHHVVGSSILFLITMAIMFASAYYVVASALSLTSAYNIPAIFAGLFLISLGTCLPELTFSIEAIMAKHKSIAIGDILGNVMLDSTFALGIVAMIVPFDVDLHTLGISTVFMVFAALMLTTYMDSEKRLTRRDGMALIGLYVLFIAVQIAIDGFAFI